MFRAQRWPHGQGVGGGVATGVALTNSTILCPSLGHLSLLWSKPFKLFLWIVCLLPYLQITSLYDCALVLQFQASPTDFYYRN